MRLTPALLLLFAGAGLTLAAVVGESGLAAYTDQESVANNSFSSIDCIVAGDTGWLDAGDESAGAAGDGDGFEGGASNAFGNGGGYATNQDGADDQHLFYDYGVSIPTGCSVAGFEVRLDWWMDSTAGVNSIDVELSWDGGTSWTSAKSDTEGHDTEQSDAHYDASHVLGGDTDTWGRSWTVGETGSANFRVRLTTLSDDGARDFYLDWTPVKVYYQP